MKDSEFNIFLRQMLMKFTCSLNMLVIQCLLIKSNIETPFSPYYTDLKNAGLTIFLRLW